MDHVPPKSFYQHPLPANLKTVPSCMQCNNSYAKDEEYAGLTFITAVDYASNNEIGRKLWSQKGQQILRRNKGLSVSIFRSMHITDVYFDKIIIGRSPCFIAKEARIKRVVSKIIRGLFYIENGRSLDYNAQITVVLSSRIKPNDAVSNIIKQLSIVPIHDIGGDVMCYKTLNAFDGEDDSVWFLKFQNKVSLSFMCFTQSCK